MPMTASALIQVNALYSNSNTDLVVPSANYGFTGQVNFDNGVGANQADKVWADTNTLAASGNTDIDLAGVLVDALGLALTFARIKAIALKAYPGNTNNVVLGGAASNQFVGPFGAATHTIAVKPGGFLMLAAPDATGWPVTAGTGDLLRVANSGAGTGVTYDLLIIGASA